MPRPRRTRAMEGVCTLCLGKCSTRGVTSVLSLGCSHLMARVLAHGDGVKVVYCGNRRCGNLRRPVVARRMFGLARVEVHRHSRGGHAAAGEFRLLAKLICYNRYNTEVECIG